MGIQDYSTTPANNTAIAGIGISGSNLLANIDNAMRQLMADLAVWYAATGGGAGGGQQADATLTALAALTTAADDMIYATGADAFATFATTAFGRSLLAAANATAAASLIGTGAVLSGTGGSSCAIALGGGIIVSIRDITISGGTASYAYGNGTTYASWVRAWTNGDDANSDVSAYVTTHGLSQATIRNNGSSFGGCLFAIGV